MHIVLVEPEIPQNTGNIVRTCAVTGSVLHLVKPLGFSVEDKFLKRAGLDYWHLLDIRYYDNFAGLKNQFSNNQFYFVTKKCDKFYTEAAYHADDFLVFGKETEGLPQKLLEANRDNCIRIPMVKGVRSLNLSNSVAIVLFEALRQQNFFSLT